MKQYNREEFVRWMQKHQLGTGMGMANAIYISKALNQVDKEKLNQVK